MSSNEQQNIGRTRTITRSSTSSDVVDLSDQNTVRVPSGDDISVPADSDPETITIMRGPYKAHFVVVETSNGRFRAMPSVGVEQRRPAILEPDNFFDFSNGVRANTKSELRERL